MENLKDVIKSYESWVAANPETVCDLETTSKWVSYFIAGRISDSNIVSELVYTLSNLMVLYHDRIIERGPQHKFLNDGPSTSHKNHQPIRNRTAASAAAEPTEIIKPHKAEKICYRLKVMLSTLEYCEVFIEISAKRAFGTRGKWLFIVLLQFAKASARFFILKLSTAQIITSPAMPCLNRRALIKQQKLAKRLNGIAVLSANSDSDAATTKQKSGGGGEHSFTFQLKRSGRLVRKVEGAPPLQYRDFKLLGGNNESTPASHCHISNMPPPPPLQFAEYLYIAKPLVHLAAMGLFGEKRWKQYFIALALDMYSIRLYHKNRHMMSRQQRLEMSRRCINILLYLMRSPFYERFTQSRVERCIDFMANNIPLLKLIAGPLREYVPYWQNTYFYLWST